MRITSQASNPAPPRPSPALPIWTRPVPTLEADGFARASAAYERRDRPSAARLRILRGRAAVGLLAVALFFGGAFGAAGLGRSPRAARTTPPRAPAHLALK